MLTTFITSNVQLRMLRHGEVQEWGRGHTLCLLGTTVSQAMTLSSLSFKSSRESSMKQGISSVSTVTKEMHGIGAGEGNKTQSSLNFVYYSNKTCIMASHKNASVFLNNMSGRFEDNSWFCSLLKLAVQNPNFLSPYSF